MNGRLIVLEGIDGCGKSTQFGCLVSLLERMKVAYRHLRFPRYDEDSSMLVRLYLGGAFGSHPDDVNAYAASTFFAVDRYASWKTDWEKDYQQGTLILADRYTTANAVHQASKLPSDKRVEFMRWLFHFEYDLLNLPRPDRVFLLDMPPEFAEMLRKKRNGSGDIHEEDSAYLARCRETSLQAAALDGWKVISCVENGRLRSVEEISREIREELFPKEN